MQDPTKSITLCLKERITQTTNILESQMSTIKQLYNQILDQKQRHAYLNQKIQQAKDAVEKVGEQQKLLDYTSILHQSIQSTHQSIERQSSILKSFFDDIKTQNSTESMTMSIEDRIENADKCQLIKTYRFSNVSQQSDEDNNYMALSLNLYKNKSSCEQLKSSLNTGNPSKSEIMHMLRQCEKIGGEMFVYSQEQQLQLLNKFLDAEDRQELESLKSELIKHNIAIPYSLRQIIWQKLIDDQLHITNQYYEILKSQSKTVSTASKRIIKQDLKRTYPNLPLFNQNQILFQNLRQGLEMFDIYYKSMGYVQGMGYPYSILLLVMPKQKAFKCFCNLIIKNEFIRRMYLFEPRDYQLKIKTFEFLVKKYVPKLSRLFQQANISCEVLLVQWFFSLYCRAFKISVVMNIWDRLIIEGEHILYCVAISILKILQNRILEDHIDQAFTNIKELSHTIEYPQLNREISKLNINYSRYIQIIKNVK